MKKKDYENTINLQVNDLFTLVDVQTDICFGENALFHLMGEEGFTKIKRIIITGCGDSYSAAGVAAPILHKLASLDSCEAPDPMMYSVFYTQEDTVTDLLPDEVLVVAISASGNSTRILDILETANSHGAGTMLITNNPESAGGELADMLFNVKTPPGLNSPGLRSYFVSLIALIALGAYIALKKKIVTDEEYLQVKQQIVTCTKAFEARFDTIDNQMFELAQDWRSFTRFAVIGDDAQYFSAQFVEEKFYECGGLHTRHFDTEDWCHINFFVRNPETVGTIIHSNRTAPNFDRAVETARVAHAIGRPTLVVTDADPARFEKGVAVCQVPKLDFDYAWLMPVIDFIPGSILAGYIAAVQGKNFFGGRYDFRRQVFLGSEN